MAHRLVIFLLTACVPSLAGSMVYTTLSAWQTSAPGVTSVLDFESSTPAFYSSFTWSPFSFAASTGGMWILPGANAGTGSGRYLTTDLAPTLNISLASGVFGVAFNLGSNSTASQLANIVATDILGTVYTNNSIGTSGTAGPAIFWGLRSDKQLASIQITFTTTQPQLDNLRYANAPLPPQGPVVPEPAPWALVAAGAVLVFLRRRPPSPFR